MSNDRLEVSVTFVPAKGYVASAPELRQPVTALSLGGLRRRIEALLLPDHVVLQLDIRARREREERPAVDVRISPGRRRRRSDGRSESMR
jgi:hypothetical protein